MDLGDHFRVITRNWWRILLAAAVVGAAVYVVSARRAKVYEATAQLSATPGERNTIPVAQDETVFLASTYAQRATTKPVIQSALKAAKLKLSVMTAMARVSSASSSTVGVLTVTAQGSSPQAATTLANAVANALVTNVKAEQDQILNEDLQPVNQQIAQVAAQLQSVPADAPERTALEDQYTALLQAAVARETQPEDRAELVAAAIPPSTPASPAPLRDATLGFLIALVVVGELTVAFYALNDRLPRSGDRDEIARLFDLPVLVSIPDGDDSDEGVVEAFRYLRTSLNTALMAGAPTAGPILWMANRRAAPKEAGTQTIAVVSATAHAGKSFTSINLARSMAAQQSGVLLIDADLRRPVIGERLELPRRPGLTEILSDARPKNALHAVGLSRGYVVEAEREMLVLTSGRACPDPVAMLGGDIIHPIIECTGVTPSYAIFDTSPAMLFADALALAPQCDATIFVVDVREAGVRATRNAISMLTNSGANIVGLVLNRDPSVRSGRYYDAYRSPRAGRQGQNQHVTFARRRRAG